MVNQEQVAEKLLWGLWRSIAEDYKTRYPRDIWEHFENAIRSASYTDSLKVFLNNFKRRLPTELQSQYSKDMLSIVNCGQDDEILNWMRTETTYLVLLVRIQNQERKEAYL